MLHQLTNGELRQLILDLGFVDGELVKNNHRVFRHPESKCEVVLPANRSESLARQADVLGVRDHLDQQGHLASSIFDQFVRDRKLPAA